MRAALAQTPLARDPGRHPEDQRNRASPVRSGFVASADSGAHLPSKHMYFEHLPRSVLGPRTQFVQDRSMFWEGRKAA